MNEKWAQTLLVQITAQLQALATLSPTTFRQIQPQLLQAFMSSVPQSQQLQVLQQFQEHPHSTQQAAQFPAFNPSSIGQGMQLTGPTPTAPANTTAVIPNVMANPKLSSTHPAPSATSASTRPATNSANVGSQGLISIAPPTSFAFTNTPFGSVGSLNQAHNNSQPTNLSTNIQPAPPPQQHQHQYSQIPLQQQNQTQHQVPQTATKDGSYSSSSINGTSLQSTTVTEVEDPVRDAINLLRQNHEDALNKARREQESERLKMQNVQRHGVVSDHKDNIERLHLRKRRKTSFEGSKQDTTTSTSSNEGDTTTTATKLTSRSSSSLTNNSTVDFNGKGMNENEVDVKVGKKTNGVNSSITNNYNRRQYLAPLGTKTDTSSGSGCTTNPFDTEESTSSAERLSDEMKTGSCSSSNSSSDDDKEQQHHNSSGSGSRHQSDHKKSGPLKKRKQYKSTNNGGITLRNLADHNVRMDALRGEKKH